MVLPRASSKENASCELEPEVAILTECFYGRLLDTLLAYDKEIEVRERGWGIKSADDWSSPFWKFWASLGQDVVGGGRGGMMSRLFFLRQLL